MLGERMPHPVGVLVHLVDRVDRARVSDEHDAVAAQVALERYAGSGDGAGGSGRRARRSGDQGECSRREGETGADLRQAMEASHGLTGGRVHFGFPSGWAVLVDGG